MNSSVSRMRLSVSRSALAVEREGDSNAGYFNLPTTASTVNGDDPPYTVVLPSGRVLYSSRHQSSHVAVRQEYHQEQLHPSAIVTTRLHHFLKPAPG